MAILKYIESLARQMDPTDFGNSSETRLAVSRIITWTTEPKSSDVRKVNVPEFDSIDLSPVSVIALLQVARLQDGFNQDKYKSKMILTVSDRYHWSRNMSEVRPRRNTALNTPFITVL